MNQNILLTLIEFIASLIIEGIILTFIFQKIANRTQKQNEQQLQNEMNNIEKQNKFIYQQLQLELQNAKNDIISQIKESSNKG
jgi:type II secretory pathway pseudopilin PulG